MSDTKEKEIYLQARGWIRNAFVPEGEPAWFIPGRSAPMVGIDRAAALQLKNDVVGFVFMLESVDEKRPGTRQLIGRLLSSFILDILQEMVADKTFMADMAVMLSDKMKGGLPTLFADPKFREAIDALRTLWRVTDTDLKDLGGYKKSSGEEPN